MSSSSLQRARAPRAVGVAVALAACLGAWLPGAPAAALELWDGRVNVSGYYETQLRGMARDLDGGDGYDLTQWAHILNVESEVELAPYGLGPLEVLTLFSRLQVRYDCVYTRGCGLLPSADAFGDRANRVPDRLGDGRRAGYRSSGNIFNGDTRQLLNIPRRFLPFKFRDRPDAAQKPSPLFTIQGIDTLFDTPGVDGVFGNADDAAPFYFSEQLEDPCLFTFRKTRGSQDGVGVQTMGPWNMDCPIEPIGALRNKRDPLSAAVELNREVLPLAGPDGVEGTADDILAGSGPGSLPLRPTQDTLFFTNPGLEQARRDGEFDDFDQRFRQAELEWNHGAAQQDEKELKELYLDIEMFDSRLWLRLGKQTIVWGKTELFRNQDLWNPQDLALSSLPQLEDSRIGLWGARGVWHFWNVGPLRDVRAEAVALFDQFEPTDLGRCGEPYAPNPVCDKTFGLFAHGLTGVAVAGERRPPDPWNSAEGLEVGARLEWRWSRFTFSISDYWGYGDLPYQKTLYRYSRNVDPETGRPRRAESTGDCVADATGDGIADDPACLTPANALAEHPANQQIFRLICATSIGFTALDPTVCAQGVFNSRQPTPGAAFVDISTTLSVVLSGQTPATGAGGFFEGLAEALAGMEQLDRAAIDDETLLAAAAGGGTPLVPLNQDPGDGAAAPVIFGAAGLQPFLTDQQEALLGCGPFYGTRCDIEGLDLMNAEASALFQSFPGFEGSFTRVGWDTTDASVAQPGTTGFEGGPVCTRFEDGRLRVLPGCRGPGPDGLPGGGDDDPGYTVAEDGRVIVPAQIDPASGVDLTALHPFAGEGADGVVGTADDQLFANEMAIFSWNTLMGLVAFSGAPPVDTDGSGLPDNDEDGDGVVDVDVFDPTDPFRPEGCSFRRVEFCSVVQALYQVTGVQRPVERAGGNGAFGRRDFVWHGGKDLQLRYQRQNVLGFSTDFAEDWSKSNWSLEFTWENDVLLASNDEFDGLSEVDRYNLTVSADRPTFVSFLNQGRTFFINSQWFFQYVDDYDNAFQSNGPLNVLATLLVQTGYFQDRLLPSVTFVYDFGSNSGAVLPEISYRYTAAFQVSFGLNFFTGREEPRDMPLEPVSMSNRVGRHAAKDFYENGLSAIRDRDEIYARLRWTF